MLREEVVEYTLARFEQELVKAIGALGGELEQMRQRKVKLEEEVRNFTQVIADGYYSPSVMAEITKRESEIAEITNRVLESRPESVRARLKGIRHFVVSRLQDVRGLLNSDPQIVKAELSKHIQKITLHPDGGIYVASGTWDLLGSGRMECAGGGNCTIRPHIDFVKELAA